PGESLSAAEAKRRLLGKSVLVDGVHFEVLFPCLSADEFLDVMSDDKVMTTSWDTATHVLRWFHRGAGPYVPASSWEKLRPRLREELKTRTWPTDPYERPAMTYFLAAAAGLHRELLALVRSWPDDAYGHYDWDDYYHVPQLVVFGLGSAELVS